MGDLPELVGDAWIPMGHPCQTIGINGIPMVNPWAPTGDPWEPMGATGDPWECMEGS